MKLYLVGPNIMKQDIIDKVLLECPGIGALIPYNNKKDVDKVITMGFRNVMLDSGAYYAFTQNKTIDINELTNFYLMLKEKYSQVDFTFVALDVIGKNDNGWQSLYNWQYMENKIQCIPTFHYGDDWEILDKYVETEDYIALGGLVPIKGNPQKLNSFLSKVFSRHSNIKFHLFGINSIPLIKKFNIFSVDASTWLGGGKFGKLITSWGKFHVAPNCQTRLDTFDAEKFGVIALLKKHDIEYPLPEGFDLQLINYINICTLYNELVLADKNLQKITELELF